MSSHRSVFLLDPVTACPSASSLLGLACFLIAACVVWGPAAAATGEPAGGMDRSPREPGTDGWWPQAQRFLQEAEYEITWQTETKLPGGEPAWSAPNRAQNLRTYFTNRGIQVVRRTEEIPSWRCALELVGYGRESGILPVGEPVLTPEANRIEYDRGGIVEWYVNDRRGLEQGFILREPPVVTNNEAGEHPALLSLVLRTSLTPVPSLDGQAIDFHAGRGMQTLRYGELLVTDAENRRLPAWMELFHRSGSTGIRLVFDDREAAYPVTIDPLLQDQAWSHEGDQSAANFGLAVAGVGNVNGDGCCDDDGDGICDRDCADEPSCACSGTWRDYDDVVVGAPYYDAGELDEGAVFLFEGSASGLGLAPAWMTDGDLEAAEIGYSVSGAGDVNADGYADVIVGAPHADLDQGVNEGMALVYYGSATGLDHQGDPSCRANADWCQEGNQTGGPQFGSSVTAGNVNGDGCCDDDLDGICDRDCTDEPSCACSGTWRDYDDVLVSAPWYDHAPNDEGVVMVFAGSADGPASTPLSPWLESGELGANMGFDRTSVAVGDLDGNGFDDVVAGAVNLGTDDSDGGLIIFWFDASGPTRQYFYNHDNDWGPSQFGQSVALCDLNGDGHLDVVAGDPEWDIVTNCGLVLVWLGSPVGPDAQADNVQVNNAAYAHFGESVACAGNVDGNGCCDDDLDGLCDRDCTDRPSCDCSGTWHDYDDVLVGAPQLPVGGDLNRGAAYLFHGAEAAGWLPRAWSRIGDQAGGFLGRAVAGAGDVNGDGYADVIIGSPYYDGDKTDEGAAFVHHGAPNPRASDLVRHLLGEPGEDVPAQLRIYDDSTSVPAAGDELFDPSANDISSLAAYYGPTPGSVVLSTGLAQELGRGDTDFGFDDLPDLVRWQFELPVPPSMMTLRFTTQLITNEVAARRSNRDGASVFFVDPSDSTPGCNSCHAGMDVASKTNNPPISQGVNVENMTSIRMVFDVEDDGDGRHDTALIISRMYFSEVPLPEGTDCIDPGGHPDFLTNPEPHDVSVTAGTYSFQKELLSLPGIGMPFNLSVRYNSASVRSGALGEKWTHSYESSVQKIKTKEDRDRDGTLEDHDLVVLRLPSGIAEYFECSLGYTCGSNNSFPPDWSGTTFYKPKHKGTFSRLREEWSEFGLLRHFVHTTKDHAVHVFAEDLDDDADGGDPDDLYDVYALSSITDSNDNQIVLEYDSSHRLDYVVDTRGKVTTFNYDDNDLLTSVEHATGGVAAVVSFDYLGAVNSENEIVHYLEEFTDPNGHVTSFDYDERGNLLSGTDDDGVRFVRNEYEEFDGLAVKQKGDRVVVRRNAIPEDPGAEMVFEADLLRTVDRPMGGDDSKRGRLENLYDVKGRSVQTNMFLGLDDTGTDCNPAVPPYDPSCWAMTETTFDEYNNPTLTIDPLLGETAMQYDTRGNLLCRKDAEGNVVTMTYDVLDNLVSRAIQLPGVTDCAAATDCSLASPPPPGGPCLDVSAQTCTHVTAYCYDTKNNLIREYDSRLGGEFVQYTYDTQGLRNAETDRRGYVTNYEYYDDDGYLRLLKEPQPDDPSNSNDSARPRTEYEYDALGRVTRERGCAPNSQSCVLGPETTYLYDPGGNLLLETDPEGNETSYTYDSWDRILSMISPATQSAPDGADTRYAYTPTGRQAALQGPPVDPLDEDPDSTRPVTAYSYDAEDRLVRETDPLGYATAYVCDAADRVAEVQTLDSDGVTPVAGASATYDAAGNMLSVTDPNGAGHTTTFDYDLLGRVTQETDAEGNEVETAYDDRGLVTSIKSGDGATVRRTVEYDYDVVGQLTTVELWDGDSVAGGTLEATLGNTLDPNGNRTQTDDSRFVDDPATPTVVEGPIHRSFDGLNRLLTRTDPFGHTVSYEYDLVGNLISLCYDYDPSTQICDGFYVDYGYDALNRLRTVCAAGSCDPASCDLEAGDFSGCTAAYLYDAVGNLTETDLADGSFMTYGYDGAHRLIDIRDRIWQRVPPPSFPWDGVAGADVTADALATRSVALGDVDGDGDLDLVAGNYNQRNRLYLNNGTADPWNGVAGSDITADALATRSVALGDVDGDGDLDLVAGGYAQPNRLYLNNGTGAPWNGVAGSDITADAYGTYSVALGDVDGDGDLDLVAGNYAQPNRLYLNNGTADPWNGVDGSNITADPHNTLSVALGDVDDDGDLDLVAGNTSSQANRLYLNNGTADPWNGVDGSDITADAHSTRPVALGDVDGDGDLDLVAGTINNQPNRLYLNNGTADPWNGVAGFDITADAHNTGSVALGDVDGDGDLDLVAGNNGQANRLYLNNGTADPWIGVAGSDIAADAHSTNSVALGDVDGDGDLDLVAGNNGQPNRLYLSDILRVNYRETFTLNAAGQRTAVNVTLPEEPWPGFGALTPDQESFDHDAANRLTSRSAAHDADGNMTAADLVGQAACEKMRYDALNQLTGIDIDSDSACSDPSLVPNVEYRYDADGYRVEAKWGQTIRRYVHDVRAGLPRLLEERDGNDALVARYVHGLGLISRWDPTYTDRYYHFDARGSTLALTDANGVITDQYRYDPYGAVIDQDGPLAEGTFADRNPFTYNGRDGVFDDATGLYFMQTRYYSPDLMRFVQRDGAFSGTLRDPQSLNRYAYVNGDPILRVDPTGEFWGSVIGAAISVAIEVATADELTWEGVIGAAAEGAIAGACPSCGLGGTMALGALGVAAKKAIAGDNLDWKLAEAAALGGAFGGLGHGVGRLAGKSKALQSVSRKLGGTKAYARMAEKKIANQSFDVAERFVSGQLTDYLEHPFSAAASSLMGGPGSDWVTHRIISAPWYPGSNSGSSDQSQSSAPDSAVPQPPVAAVSSPAGPSGPPSPCR